MVEQILSGLGLTKGSAVGGFLGALVSLKFVAEIAQWSFWKKATSVASGCLIAAYSTTLTIEVLELSPKADGAIAFMGGLFGMSLAAAIIKNLPAWMDAVKHRIGGGAG